ncbi:MAG: PIN domain-containing protein [Xenococcus sp. MO_188.B8]|nr:PIN domain-containing protein [Xenococcus sp. MO_188.B8]
MGDFFRAMDRGEFQVVTSTLTLTEVLVHPLRNGHNELAQQYQEILLNQEYLTACSVSPAIAELAAQLRATNNLKTPDAIQIATAMHNGAEFFVTNDGGLCNVSSTKIREKGKAEVNSE